jgi:hypothetical protein
MIGIFIICAICVICGHSFPHVWTDDRALSAAARPAPVEADPIRGPAGPISQPGRSMNGLCKHECIHGAIRRKSLRIFSYKGKFAQRKPVF